MDAVMTEMNVSARGNEADVTGRNRAFDAAITDHLLHGGLLGSQIHDR